MALMNCPECGKENVSTTASACPNCGFAIKEYIANRVRQQEIRQNELREAREKEAEIRRRKAAEQRRKETEATRQADAIKNLQIEIAANTKYMLVSVGVCVGTFLFACMLAFFSIKLLGYLFMAAAFIAFFAFCYFLGEKQSRVKDLDLAKQKYEEYEKLLGSWAEETERYQQAQHKQWEANHPICPACGSRNTSRISTLNRTASVATFGLASSKIGKQYECKACKHKW